MVSIIVPVYNVEKYIGECIESIIAQTYNDWELILVDDGSTDFSGRISDQYASKDSRISVVHIENGGLSCARNKGIEVAKGDLITFVDGDDVLYPYSLSLLVGIINDSGADIAMGVFNRAAEYSVIDTYSNKLKVRLYTSVSAIEGVLYQKEIHHSASAKIYRRDLFEKIKFTEGILYEDLDFFYKVFVKCKRIAYIDIPVYFYRNTPGSILNSWSTKRFDVLEVTANIEKFIAKEYPALLPAARDRRLSANFNMLALASIRNEKTTADKCWEIIKKYRRESLLNPKVRLKNKFGILLSYIGRRPLVATLRLAYKH